MHRPLCIWITGLPAAGKSTLAVTLDRELKRRGALSTVLDGDALRTGLSSDLGFTLRDRSESTRRAGEAARLMVNAGIIAIVSLISPIRKDRDAARARFADGEFIEVFLDTPPEVCEARDPKGHYRQARQGALKEFTGISSPYEPPLAAELTLTTVEATPEDLALLILADIAQRQD